MTRAIHGAPAEALRQALKALAELSFWISWTADADLAPEPVVSARCMRDAASALRKSARLLDEAADQADPPPETVRRAAPPGSGGTPNDASRPGSGRPAAGTTATRERQLEAEPSPARADACRPERAVSRAPVHPSTEIRMNHIAPPPEQAIRDIPLCQLALAPENVRKTPPDEAADAQLVASIKSHGLLGNLVVRPDEPAEDGAERFAVVAGGRRLAALVALVKEGWFNALHPVPCKVAANGDAGELSLAENVIRIAMHPADQAVAFSRLAQDGATVAAIAARFGVTERLVEQRLRLGNAAPELLDAYRADEIDLETLKAFSVTTDHDRQRAIWEKVSAQGHRPAAWQVKRLLTEERVPAGSPMARFVGVAAYEAAGGPVLRDLFADEYEHGVWLEDPALLIELAMKKLQAAADELATRWKWAEPMADVDWSATARFGRIHPEPGEPTDEEKAEIEKLRTRHDELVNMDEDQWTDELVEEAEAIEPRLDEIEAEVESRARFKREDFAIAGCIATIGRDGSLQVIQGLVKPEDMPKPAEAAGATTGAQPADDGSDSGTDTGRIAGPATSTPAQPPKDREAEARKEAGVGIGLADDLRSIRTALVKAHLAEDFEAAFDLMVFQLVRAVFARGYTASWHALDIAFNETADRPTNRTNDDDFAKWSPGETMLEDWSHLPFEWMEGDDDAACFAALRALPRADKEKLLTSMKCPSLIRAIGEDLDSGRSAVVQLVSTGEALMERRIAEIPASEWDDINVDLTPRETVIEFLAHAFPVQLQEPFTDDEGNLMSRPVFDEDGNPVVCQEAAARRDALIEKLASLPPVPSALDQIVQHFGHDAVAEVTGRSRRVLKVTDARGERLALRSRPASANLAETAAFMDGEKRILVFSMAGGTGRSYHADLACGNTERRIHYLLEPGWRADQAIQGLGRTHRTRQASAPLFRPVATDVKGERRFIATIARRLDSLGAITRGQRDSQTAMGGDATLFRESDNLESLYAKAALRQFYMALWRGAIEGWSLADFEEATGLKLVYEGALKEDLPPMSRFLNRLLALPIAEQNQLFAALETRIEANIEQAMEAGSYEVGVETVRADSLATAGRETLYEHPRTGAVTDLVEIVRRDRLEPTTAETALDIGGYDPGPDGKPRLVVNARSKRAAVLLAAPSRMFDDGGVQERVRLVRPATRETMAGPELEASNWRPADEATWRTLWEHEIAELPTHRDSRFWLAAGLLLPVWDRLPFENMRVRRLTTDDGEALIGRVLDAEQVRAVRTSFGLDGDFAMTGEEAFEAVMGRGTALALANGWRLARRRIMGADRVEIEGPVDGDTDALKRMGCTVEIVSWRARAFAPGAHVLDRILERWPLAG